MPMISCLKKLNKLKIFTKRNKTQYFVIKFLIVKTTLLKQIGIT